MKVYVGVVDEENKVLHKQRFRNELPLIFAGLDPLKEDIEGIVVESTFNWYWLVDGLMDQGYRVHLANVSAIKQYEGVKQIDLPSHLFFTPLPTAQNYALSV